MSESVSHQAAPATELFMAHAASHRPTAPSLTTTTLIIPTLLPILLLVVPFPFLLPLPPTTFTVFILPTGWLQSRVKDKNEGVIGVSAVVHPNIPAPEEVINVRRCV